MTKPKFVHGAGDGKKTGCLMTMSNILVGQGEKTDTSNQVNQVCTVMRSFIVATNDTIPEDILGEVYAPLAAQILGTITKDPKIMQERAIMFAEWADAIPLPKKYVIRTSLTEKAYEQFRKGQDPVMVASDVAALAANRAVKVLRTFRGESQRKTAEACRDILAKVASSHERKPVKIVNVELAKEFSGACKT